MVHWPIERSISQAAVSHAGMAPVGAKNAALLHFPRGDNFPHLQAAITEVAVDQHPIALILQRVLEIPGATQSPLKVVILEDKGNGFEIVRVNVPLVE